MSIKIPYGLKEGKLVHISAVDSGLHKDITCICSSCNITLIARKGKKMKHHFAHTAECLSPDTALESLLHLLVKEVLEEGKTLKLPNKNKYAIFLDDKFPTCKFDSVNLEKKISLEGSSRYIVADVVGYKNDYPLIIEVFVTHKVNKQKKDLIREINIPAIEIDFSGFTYDTTKEEIEKVLADASGSKWIYYPIRQQLIDLYSIVFKEEELINKSACPIYRKEEVVDSRNERYTDCSSCPMKIFIKSNDKVLCSGGTPFYTREDFERFISEEELSKIIESIQVNNVIDRGQPYGIELLNDFLGLVEEKKHLNIKQSDLRYMRKMFKDVKLGHHDAYLNFRRMERIVNKMKGIEQDTF